MDFPAYRALIKFILAAFTVYPGPQFHLSRQRHRRMCGMLDTITLCCTNSTTTSEILYAIMVSFSFSFYISNFASLTNPLFNISRVGKSTLSVDVCCRKTLSWPHSFCYSCQKWWRRALVGEVCLTGNPNPHWGQSMWRLLSRTGDCVPCVSSLVAMGTGPNKGLGYVLFPRVSIPLARTGPQWAHVMNR